MTFFRPAKVPSRSLTENVGSIATTTLGTSIPMTRLCRFSDQVTLGSSIGMEELRDLASADHRAVIDLRHSNESWGNGLEPGDLARRATALGVTYHQIAIVPGARDDGAIAAVRALLRHTSGRVLLHCTDGSRAAALALIHLACDRGETLGQCYSRAQTLEHQTTQLGSLVPMWIGYILDHGSFAEDGLAGRALESSTKSAPGTQACAVRHDTRG